MMHLRISVLLLALFALIVSAGPPQEQDWSELDIDFDAELLSLPTTIMSEDDYYATLGFMSPSIFDPVDYFTYRRPPSPPPPPPPPSPPPPVPEVPHQYMSALFSQGAAYNPFAPARSRSTPPRAASRRGRPALRFLTPTVAGSSSTRSMSENAIPKQKKVVDAADRPFVCEICQDTFVRSEHRLRHHRSIHTKEKPFKCDICQKAFSRADNCRDHRAVHGVTR